MTRRLPDFVRAELEGYVDCGLLCRGFALLSCEGCQQKKLVAFSCRGRGFCPSCMGRRMAQTAANVVDHILPRGAPLRQFVLTVPFELRARLAYDRVLSTAVGRLFVDSLLGFYRRGMKDELGVSGKSGALTVLQRTSADLRCNPHWHSVVLDGVFVPSSEAGVAPVFHALPELTTEQLGDLLQAVSSFSDAARACSPGPPERPLVLRTRQLRCGRGESVLVTDRNEPLALLVPVQQATPEELLERLAATPRIAWSGGKPRGLRSPPRVRGPAVADAVVEDRR